MAGPSLVELFATIPDPRKPRGRIHPLTAVLSLAAVAMLAGMKSLEAIAQFGRDHGPALAHALGFRRKKTPAKSTLSEIFRAIDPDAFEAALRRWAQGRAGGGEALALDGKALTGSRAGDAPGAHLLAAFAPAAAAVLGQLRVDAKTNEHKAALRLLGVLPLAGKVVSGDAMFTHRDFARAVRGGGGDYLLVVKDNQPELKAAIESALHGDADFSPLPAEAEGRRRAGGPDGGQGARPPGAAAADEHDGAERLPGLAGRGAGLRAGAGADVRRQDERRGGLRHHQRGA
jgi:predicted transposase YbfD/YdcC